MNYLPWLMVVLAGAALFLLQRRSFAGAEQARAELRQGALVIDVRSPAEYASGHLPAAINIPVHELGAQIARHAPDKGKPLLLHCQSGVRSGMGKRVLQRLGYARVLNLGSYRRAGEIVRSVGAGGA